MPQNGGNAAKRVANSTAGPWKRWKKSSRHGRAIRFIETYLRSPKGEGHGKLMKLAEFQKSWLEEVLADGVRAAVMPTPAGNGKSTFGGAVAAWATFDEDETGAPQVPVIATTLGQAIKSCYGVAASMIRSEHELADRCIEYTGIATPRIYVPANEGVLFPISNDIDGLQGLDYSLAVVDEIGFQSIDVWSAMMARAGKRSRSLLWGTGTPGLDRENALWMLREKAVAGDLPKAMKWREYAADDGCAADDQAQWRKANPALAEGFMAPDALELALGAMPEAAFRVFRLGQWVDGVESWLGKDGRSVWLDAERSTKLIDKGATWIGIDVGIKRDSTAVVAVQHRWDDPSKLHAVAKFWLPSEDNPVDVTDVMAYIRQLATQYQVGAVSFDPRFFDVPAKILYDEGIPMVEIPQSVERMTGIVGQLFTAIKAGDITHDTDPEFTRQVLSAIPRLNERGFTLSKGKSRGHIDGAIALALAVDRAQHPKKARAPLVIV